MPGLDGFETCRQLKTNQSTAHLPVIFMTALSDSVDKVRGFEVGAVDYVTKPFHHEEVLARVRSHLTISRMEANLRRTNERLTRLNAELSRRNNDLALFSRTVAHDLKNPLNAMIGLAEMMAEDCSQMPVEELREVSQQIAGNGTKMNDIIESLLLLAGVRDQQAHMRVLDMGKIVGDARQRLTGLFQDKEVEVVTPDTWPSAIGYPLWVEEVWVNYLSNAVKYGGQPPRVEMGADTLQDGMIRFWVSDNGAGLSSEEQARLFEPFTRLNQANVQGYGLGLSIVRHILEKMKGMAGVESRPGKGSTFFFTLPVAPDAGGDNAAKPAS
jgi:signal transduction histidine kinase